jgi:hypothetical protein
MTKLKIAMLNEHGIMKHIQHHIKQKLIVQNPAHSIMKGLSRSYLDSKALEHDHEW